MDYLVCQKLQCGESNTCETNICCFIFRNFSDSYYLIDIYCIIDISPLPVVYVVDVIFSDCHLTLYWVFFFCIYNID